MRHKKVNLSALLFLVLGLTGLEAQESIPASGGNASGRGGTSSYTIGQVVYTTDKGSSGSVLQGIQKSFEISELTGIKDVKGITLHCSVHPNPAVDFLVLKIDGEIESQYIATLLDINGKILENLKIQGNETSIGMRHLQPGTYLLKIVRAQHAVPQPIIKIPYP